MLEEYEQTLIKNALAEGKTPQELMYQGLNAAIEPKVLK
jgi:hypothetical protein